MLQIITAESISEISLYVINGTHCAVVFFHYAAALITMAFKTWLAPLVLDLTINFDFYCL